MSSRNGKVASLSDVAAHCGLSPSTVSHIVAKREGLRYSQATRERVLAACEELGYVPDSRACSLRMKRNLLIGVYTGFAFHNFGEQAFQAIIGGILKASSDTNYEVIMFGVHREGIRGLLDALKSNRIDGALVLTNDMVTQAELHELRSYSFPVLILEGSEDKEGVVRVDERLGMNAAVKHLVDLGHNHIGYIDAETFSLSRVQYFKDAASAQSVEGETMVLPRSEDPHLCSKAVAERQNQANPPTAYIIGHPSGDIKALDTVNHFTRELGLQIPQDLSIIGWDGLPISHVINLTTVAKPFQQMGEIALTKLLERINDPKCKQEQIILNPELIIRGTTGPR